MKKHDSIRARARWKLLAQALKKNRLEETLENNEHSVRRFLGFGMFDVKKEKQWLSYKLKDQVQDNGIKIRFANISLKAEDLIGFNNTGNVCIWPSEEILAYYCNKHKHLFAGTSVCELAGGMTCLAGMQVASDSLAKEILLTDGNEASIENLELIINKNSSLLHKTTVLNQQLVWSENPVCFGKWKNHFDFIICADALFFDDAHNALVQTIKYILKDTGRAIIFAPRRSKTFDAFVDMASKYLKVHVEEKYDDVVWNLHETFLMEDELYSTDLHYPLLLEMTHK